MHVVKSEEWNIIRKNIVENMMFFLFLSGVGTFWNRRLIPLEIRDGSKKTKYRKILFYVLLSGIIAAAVSGYFFVWRSVPSTIMLKSGVEQQVNLHVPVSGELYREVIEVSGNTGTPIKQKDHSLWVDFQRPVTMIGGQVDNYTMDLKLFGVFPFKTVNVQVIKDTMLRPAGIPIGIYVETDGVLVVGIGSFEDELGQMQEPGKNILQPGDYILEVNEQNIESKKALIDRIDHCEGQPLVFKVRRGENELEVKAQPKMNQNGEYKMGIWVRDNAQGVGTMTYVDEQGNFGALGHGINDVDTSTLMTLGDGKLYHTEIIGITRGGSGRPGELTGYIEYDDRNIMGTIEENNVRGIFGNCSEEIRSGITSDYMEVALKQDICIGPAQIISTVDGERKYYDVEIVDLNLQNDNINRGIVLQVTDEELLATTGGIVQGMSGSPIIQNGRLVGAVTHVLVRDASKGYGIFIEEMLEHN